MIEKKKVKFFLMKKILAGGLLCLFLFSCGNRKVKIDPFDAITSLVDTAAWDASKGILPTDTQSVAEEKTAHWVEADELFDDFIFNYATDTLFQRRRTVFPLPYYKGDIPLKIEKEQWKHDSLFARQTCYTLLFDREEDMDLVGDTSLSSVQVEWIFLRSRKVKRYYFQRMAGGVWMLEAMNLRNIEEADEGNENFVDFYEHFVADSIYEARHIHEPLQFITIDPDDEFSILETTLDRARWFTFRPALPTDKLSNINYGQRNEDLATTKILKMNGVSNGYSNILYFRKRKGEWELYKYEDSSM